MDISELKKELIDKKLKHFYIFTGDELGIQDIYINKIKEVSELELVRVEYLKDVFSKFFTRTLVKTKPKVYVIRNDEDYLSKESNWDSVLSKQNFNGNIVIMLYSGNEKNSKFNKAHEEYITKFDFIGSNLLSNRLVATTGLQKNFCDELVKICSNNYGRLKNEVYKLLQLCNINGYNINTAYLMARKENFIHEDIGDIIFDFTDAIVERKVNLTYSLLDKIWQTEDGVSIKLLSVLYNSFRNILMVQTTPYKERTEEILGLTKAQIFVTSQKCNYYSDYEVVNIIKLIRKLEKNIKIGLVEDKFAIDYFLSEIW